jgi:hypothetical protein
MVHPGFHAVPRTWLYRERPGTIEAAVRVQDATCSIQDATGIVQLATRGRTVNDL